jgi:hypothetical protein
MLKRVGWTCDKHGELIDVWECPECGCRYVHGEDECNNPKCKIGREHANSEL